VVVLKHGFRSVVGVESPINLNKAHRKLLQNVPGLSRSALLQILKRRPFRSIDEAKELIPRDLVEKLGIEV
jgi:radical SAM superfamily enzyme with C-terminal helix-hairpin-helix motif